MCKLMGKTYIIIYIKCPNLDPCTLQLRQWLPHKVQGSIQLQQESKQYLVDCSVPTMRGHMLFITFTCRSNKGFMLWKKTTPTDVCLLILIEI